MNSIMLEAEEKRPHHIEIISCRIYDILLQIHRSDDAICAQNVIETTQNSELIQDKKTKKLVHEAIAYIDEHITQKISVADLASQFNYSSSYFSTAFKKATGVSPQQFITLRKIAVAKVLIRRNELSISAISDFLQFSNVAAFSNTFKKHSGITPGQFSQQVRDCTYINLTEHHDLPDNNIRSIEPTRADNIYYLLHPNMP
jgi:AraC-like DNA-binding protein